MAEVVIVDCAKFREDFKDRYEATVSVDNPAWVMFLWMPETDREAEVLIEFSTDDELEAMWARCVIERGQ